MPIVPYDHQKTAVAKLAKPSLKGRLIGDDMGLGKTLEGLLIDSQLRSPELYPHIRDVTLFPMYKRPTLIVAPKATHYDAWDKAIRQINDHWDEDAFRKNIAIIDPKNRDALVQRLKTKPLPMYVVVHYEALRLTPELKDLKWFHIIADEVHRVKSRKTQQTVALKALDAFFKTGLSGTPADDKVEDIWSVLNWLYPKEFSSYWRFTNTYCEHKEEVGRGGRTFRKITGVRRDRVGELHKQWDSWYLRRTKEEVIDLPPKYYTELHVDLHPNQRRAYDQMRKDMIAWVGEHEDIPLTAPVVVAQLVRLQQFALASVDFYRKTNGDTGVKLVVPSAKLDRLEELVDGNPNTQMVVFSQSRSMVDLVVDRLQLRGYSAGAYTGNVSERRRNEVVRDFQAGNLQLFVGTIKAGGEGITLHSASTVVFLDRMWNPSKNGQATDRLHRIGQTKAVQVVDIVARNTVDQGRNQRIASKKEELLWLLGDRKNA